jgi:two-component system cell cycle response regulator DivK
LASALARQEVGPRMDPSQRRDHANTALHTGITGELDRLQLARHRGAAPYPSETVLIVENEESNRRLVEQILEFAGYRTVTATHGLEALHVLDQEPVDLVLIDLAMPVLDGYRATELIRTRPEYANLPVVAVTAHAMSEDRELALASGCNDYLAKPFRPNELLHVVERMLGHLRAVDSSAG